MSNPPPLAADTPAPTPCQGAAPAARGTLALLFLIIFINMVGFGVVLPVFPYFGDMIGASPAEITLAMAAYSLAQFVGAPLWGKLSDRYGRRPILVASLVGATIAYVWMAYSRDIGSLAASRAFGGLMAGNIAAAFAYVGDVTTAATRPRVMGLLGAAFGLGFIFGPAIGGLVAGDAPGFAQFVMIGWVSAGITVVAAVAAAFFLPESLTPARRAAARAAAGGAPAPGIAAVLRAKPVVALLALFTLLVIGSAAMMETVFAYLGKDVFGWGPRDVGLAFGAAGVVSVLLQGGGAGPLAQRLGSAGVANLGVAFYAAGLAALALAQDGTALVAALMLTGVGLGLFNPAFATLAANATSDGDRGLVMGLTQGASSMGRVLGPAASGFIFAGIGPRAPFATGAAVMVLALGVGLLISRGRTARAAAETAPPG